MIVCASQVIVSFNLVDSSTASNKEVTARLKKLKCAAQPA